MIVQIEVNTNCNFKCWYCQNSQYKNPPTKVMNMELFETILYRIMEFQSGKDLPLISFAAYNEPSMDPLFTQRLRLMTELGFTYWWISNLSCMTKEIVSFLHEFSPRTTNFHINMPSCKPERLSELVGIPLPEAREHIESLKLFLEEEMELSKRVDLVVHGDGSARHHEDFKHILEWASPSLAKVHKAGLVNRAGMLEGVGSYVDYHSAALLRCGVSYTSNVYIGVDGNVYLCCHDYYQRTSFGNLSQHSLQSLIGSAEYRAAYTLLRESFCRYCVFAVSPWNWGKRLVARVFHKLRRRLNNI